MMRQTLLLLIFVSSLAYSFAYIKVYQKRANDCGLSQQSSHGLRHKCLGEHQFYSKLCDATCRHPHKKRHHKCKKGCKCKKGYVRKYHNGKGPCIKPKKCKHHHKCGKHQHWSSAAGCDPTCWQPYGNRDCPFVLRPGCVCNEGYVRTHKNGKGKCVRLKHCKHCPQHERKVLCRGHCQPTCKKPHPKCSLKCKKGCRCKLGFVRQRHNGPCIKWKYCKNKKSFFKLFFKK
ncbi:hypothetical protein SSS_10529 [Sarcoptes scabiei]|uniref:TIL domain-containing protein n=1 Tax=Sarcoptes scabiei TaxID=52283 RepID=A0A834R3X9_SARSC|nr:hypothetical protein SSS_10529 [Sarcoptes scabiei]